MIIIRWMIAASFHADWSLGNVLEMLASTLRKFTSDWLLFKIIITFNYCTVCLYVPMNATLHFKGSYCKFPVLYWEIAVLCACCITVSRHASTWWQLQGYYVFKSGLPLDHFHMYRTYEDHQVRRAICFETHNIL